MSIGVLTFAFAVTLTALFQGKTTMWEGVPPTVAVVLFFVLMCVVGLLEGMQISFFAVAKLRPEDRGDGMWHKRVCEILYRGNYYNLSGFMIGRQLCVVSCMFFVARVTSLNIDPDSGDPTLWGVSAGTQKFFNLGFLGALITTIVASISWQLVASAFPLTMLGNPFTYTFLRICLFLEGTGICNGAYVLAAIYKRIYGYQRDEVYIGTAEERALKKHKDNEDNLHVGAGHLLKLPINMGREEMTLEEVTQMQEELQAHALEVADRIKELEAKRDVLAQLDSEQRDIDSRMSTLQQRRSQVFGKDDLEETGHMDVEGGSKSEISA